MEEEIEDQVGRLRIECKAIEKQIRGLLHHSFFDGAQLYVAQHNEMKAQIMLAVRHIEDTRMRLGKVRQYAGESNSIYDKL